MIELSDNVEDLQRLEPVELLEVDRLHERACCCDTFTNLGTQGSPTVS